MGLPIFLCLCAIWYMYMYMCMLYRLFPSEMLNLSWLELKLKIDITFLVSHSLHGQHKQFIKIYRWTETKNKVILLDSWWPVWNFSLRSNNTFFTLGCDRVPSCQESLFRCQQEVKRINIQLWHRLKHFWKEVSMNGLKFFWTSVVTLLVGMCFYFWPITFF